MKLEPAFSLDFYDSVHHLVLCSYCLQLAIFSPCLPVPWYLEVLSQGISRPPCAKSREYFLSGSITLHDISPPFLMNNEQVELIFFGNWPTVPPPLRQRDCACWQVHNSTRAFSLALVSIHPDTRDIL